jgi:hypothetical protein
MPDLHPSWAHATLDVANMLASEPPSSCMCYNMVCVVGCRYAGLRTNLPRCMQDVQVLLCPAFLPRVRLHCRASFLNVLHMHTPLSTALLVSSTVCPANRRGHK